MFVAWHTAAFQRLKTMPEFDGLLASENPTPAVSADDDWRNEQRKMRLIAGAHNANLRG